MCFLLKKGDKKVQHLKTQDSFLSNAFAHYKIWCNWQDLAGVLSTVNAFTYIGLSPLLLHQGLHQIMIPFFHPMGQFYLILYYCSLYSYLVSLESYHTNLTGCRLWCQAMWWVSLPMWGTAPWDVPWKLFTRVFFNALLSFSSLILSIPILTSTYKKLTDFSSGHPRPLPPVLCLRWWKQAFPWTIPLRSKVSAALDVEGTATPCIVRMTTIHGERGHEKKMERWAHAFSSLSCPADISLSFFLV